MAKHHILFGGLVVVGLIALAFLLLPTDPLDAVLISAAFMQYGWSGVVVVFLAGVLCLYLAWMLGGKVIVKKFLDGIVRRVKLP